MIVPNRFPTIQSQRRIALIGESPGSDEVKQGEPFVGMSGRFLASLLSKAGVSRESCFLGNVSQHQPPGNDISLFKWDGPEIRAGLYQLKQDLEIWKPNIVVLLGNVPLKAAKDVTTLHKLKPQSSRFKNTAWRGSLFLANEESPVSGFKCLSTYHPAYALRDYEVTPLLYFDLVRAVEESLTSTLVLPKREFAIDLSASEIIFRLQNIRELKLKVAIDIEGGIDSMSCISFATSPYRAFIVPFFFKNGTRCFTEIEQVAIWRELILTLEDPNVYKILQNGLYDRFVLHYSYRIRVRGVTDDTMVKHWELFCELKKSLAVQASIYTREPYWKHEGKAEEWQGK